MLTRFLIPELLKREKKGAIITVSSFAGIYYRPYQAMYSATKSFVDFFSRSISYEFPELDILSVRPAVVSTKMAHWLKPGFRVISTEEFVKSSLSYLGRENYTQGHWKHRFQVWPFSIMPEWLRTRKLAERAKLFSLMDSQ